LYKKNKLFFNLNKRSIFRFILFAENESGRGIGLTRQVFEKIEVKCVKIGVFRYIYHFFVAKINFFFFNFIYATLKCYLLSNKFITEQFFVICIISI